MLVACLALLAVAALHPVFATGFILTDDHEILSFTDEALRDAQLARPPTLSERIFAEDPILGRVRPMYWLVRYAEIGILKANPLAWHALFLGMGVVSSALLFGTLRLAGINRLPATFASAWLLVAPGVSSVWIRLGPVESLGVLLLVVAAYSAARGAVSPVSIAWDTFFVVSLLAATLVKEPFALVPPALVGLRLFLVQRARGVVMLRSLQNLVATLIPLGVGGLVAFTALKISVASGDSSYSGRLLAAGGSSVVRTTLANLAILTWLGGVAAPLLVAGALTEAWRRKRLTPPLAGWLVGAGLVLILVLPQLAVYRSGSGFGVGRYVLPAGIGMVTGIAAGATWLLRQKYVALYISVATVLAVSLVVFVLETWREAEIYRADSAVLAQAVNAIASSARPGTTVGIAADPVANYEFAASFPYHLLWHGRADLDRRLLVAANPQEQAADAKALGDGLAALYPGHGDLVDGGCTRVDAIVMLAAVDRVVSLMPCLAEPQFRLVTFSETISTASFLPPSARELFPPTTVSYQLLLREPS